MSASLKIDSLDPSAYRLLERLASVCDDDYYLAGSAALALHLGHRPVRGLDLMSAVHRLLPPERRDLLQSLLQLDPGIRVETARDGYLFVRSGAGTALRWYYYPYPLAAPLEELDGGLQLASLTDLGLMKLGAIISRGSRRDFVDLYLLCRRLPLRQLLAASEDKFGHVADFPLQAAKALADRSQWSDEPLPRLTTPLEVGALEDWLEEELALFVRTEIAP